MSKFVFVKDATTWWPVQWNEPVDGGGVAPHSIELRFKRTPWGPEVDALYKLDNAAFIRAVATDWRGIEDDAGRPVPFDNSDVVADMAARPDFGEALGAAYITFLRAVPETRLGNSSASLAGGPVAIEATTADGAPPASPT